MKHRATILLTSLVGIAPAAPAVAEAATVAAGEDAITFTARPGEANLVSVTATGGEIVVRDPGAAKLVDGDGDGGCEPAGAAIRCPAGSIAALVVRARDGDDRVRVAGATDDRIYGGSGADVLLAGDGADALFGDEGADELQGAGGNDRLDGGSEGDLLRGGSGSDLVTYAQRAEAVRVPLDGVDDDGSATDGASVRDNVAADVERLAGGDADDRLVGNGRGNVLAGGPGSDTLRGGGGADRLVGDGEAGPPSDDDLGGASGDDTIEDGTGANSIAGGDGDDRIVQGASPNAGDVIDGGPGSDTVSYERRTAAVRVTLHDAFCWDVDEIAEVEVKVY